MRRLAPLALALAAQAGCSLTGLNDFTIFECSSHEECEPLNQRHGYAEGACVRYQCAVDGRCRLQPRDADRDGHATTACEHECMGSSIPCDDCDDTSAAAYRGQTEVCDGIDNDCNLVVDDVASGEAGSVTLVSATDSPTWHSYGLPLPGTNVTPVAFGRSSASYFNVAGRDAVEAQPIGSAVANLNDLSSPNIQQGCPQDDVRVPVPRAPVGPGTGPTTCMTHEDCSDGVLCNGFELCDPSAAGTDAMGCVTDDPEPVCTSGFCNEERGVCELSMLSVATSCNNAELVAAELDAGRWFAAVKSPSGCGGLLRVGYFTETAGDGRLDPGRNVLFRGNVARSTSFRGIDQVTLDAMGRCTGLSRPEGEPFGVRSLAIAALPADRAAGRLRPQALVAWLAGGDVAPSAVEVLGLWHETFALDNSPQWVNATNDGLQQRLGSVAHGDVAPALLPWTGAEAGYLLAYGVDGSGISIRFVPAFPDDDEVQVPAGTTPIGPGATEHRRTEPIADLGTEVVLSTSGPARNVTLAIGRTSEGGAELGLAWRDDEGVRFSTVTFDAGAGTFTGFDPQTVASGGADEIALAHSPSGLVLPGFRRGDAVADESTTGGFVLAWRDGGTVSGARFADLDGQRVGADVVRLGGDLRRLSIRLMAEEDDAGGQRLVPRLVYHDPAAQEFRALEAFCGPG